jgi:hypothetical protein
MSRKALNSKRKLLKQSEVNIPLSVRYDGWLEVYSH